MEKGEQMRGEEMGLILTPVRQNWIPACAESTPQYAPQKHPSHWTNMLGGIEKKYSGVLNKRTRGGMTGRRTAMTVQRMKTRVLVIPVQTSILFSAVAMQRTILRAVRPLAQAMAYSRQGMAGNGRASHCGKEN